MPGADETQALRGHWWQCSLLFAMATLLGPDGARHPGALKLSAALARKDAKLGMPPGQDPISSWPSRGRSGLPPRITKRALGAKFDRSRCIGRVRALTWSKSSIGTDSWVSRNSLAVRLRRSVPNACHHSVTTSRDTRRGLSDRPMTENHCWLIKTSPLQSAACKPGPSSPASAAGGILRTETPHGVRRQGEQGGHAASGGKPVSSSFAPSAT